MVQKNTHGGARKNAGRPKKLIKKETMVVRVDKSKAPLIKEINVLPDDDLKKVYRSVYGKTGVQTVTQEHMLYEQIYQIEQDANEQIAKLQGEIERLNEELTHANSHSFETKYRQLQKELYPALARLRELVPEEKW